MSDNKMLKRKNFKRELKALLKKYDAEIHWECDRTSDLRGVEGEKMLIKERCLTKDHSNGHRRQLLLLQIPGDEINIDSIEEQERLHG